MEARLMRGLRRACVFGLTVCAVAVLWTGAQVYYVTRMESALDRAARGARSKDLRDQNFDHCETWYGRLDGFNFSRAHMVGSQVRWSSFRGAVFVGADLDSSFLDYSDFSGADMRRANLRDSSLFQATLVGADLEGADMRRANLAGADLRCSRLTGAELGGVRYDASTKWPDGFTPPRP